MSDKLIKKEKELVKKPGNKEILQEIKLLQIQYSMLINQEIERKITIIKQRNFEFANKPGKLLGNFKKKIDKE